MASSSAAASLLPPRADIFFVPRTELERSPSVLDHTFASWADELAWREEQCAFIHELGSALKISQMVQHNWTARPQESESECHCKSLLFSSSRSIPCRYAQLKILPWRPFPPQTTIATACVYLHRFFSRHSFAKHRDIVVVCGACIFLACKVEESRRKVSFLIERLRATVDPAAVALHPEAPEFVRMRDAIFDCERDVLDTIEYRLHVRVRARALAIVRSCGCFLFRGNCVCAQNA